MDYEIEIAPNQYHPIDEVDKIITFSSNPDKWITTNTETNTIKQNQLLNSLPDGMYVVLYRNKFNSEREYNIYSTSLSGLKMIFRYNPSIRIIPPLIIYALCPLY